MGRLEQHSSITGESYVVPNGLTVTTNTHAYWDTSTGALVSGATPSATKIAIGVYTSDVVGDGIKKVFVKFYRRKFLWDFPNATGLLPADRWKTIRSGGQDAVTLAGVGAVHGTIIRVTTSTVTIEPIN